MMGNVPVPGNHPHPNMMQQQPVPNQSSLSRYIMGQPAQPGGFRPQMNNMNIIGKKYYQFNFMSNSTLSNF